METVNPICDAQSSVSGEAATLFISLELSRARWLVTSCRPVAVRFRGTLLSVATPEIYFDSWLIFE
jgi:hypothetical protein